MFIISFYFVAYADIKLPDIFERHMQSVGVIRNRKISIYCGFRRDWVIR